MQNSKYTHKEYLNMYIKKNVFIDLTDSSLALIEGVFYDSLLVMPSTMPLWKLSLELFYNERSGVMFIHPSLLIEIEV